MSEKTELEKHAVIEFCYAYNKKFNRHLMLVEQCDPPLPDTRCALDHKNIFIEITHLFGAVSDAKKLLGRTGKSYPRPTEERRARMTPLNVRIGLELVDTLRKKFKKKYATDSTDPMWLLVRNANPLWDYSDFKAYQSEIKIPPRNPFDRIWLLCGQRAESGIIELSIEG